MFQPKSAQASAANCWWDNLSPEWIGNDTLLWRNLWIDPSLDSDLYQRNDPELGFSMIVFCYGSQSRCQMDLSILRWKSRIGDWIGAIGQLWATKILMVGCPFQQWWAAKCSKQSSDDRWMQCYILWDLAFVRSSIFNAIWQLCTVVLWNTLVHTLISW